MKIKNICFKNFNSYGNIYQKIDFNNENSFNLIFGQNGDGKSTISQIIEFAIYGKVLSKNLKDLPNRINKNLEVEINLDINNKNLYIKRCLEPTSLKVEFEGDDKFKNKANKSKQQELIDELINIPQVLFNNAIVLSINDFKSFIELSPDDKRKIIDKIFGLDLINKSTEKVKNDLKEFNNSLKLIESQINSKENELIKINLKIDDIKLEINKANKKEIKEIEQKEKKLKSEYKLITNEYQIIESKLEKIRENETKIYSTSINFKNKKQYLVEKINLFKKDKCPTCGTSFESDNFKHLIYNYNKELDELKEKEQQLKEKSEKLESKINIIKKSQNEIFEKINKIKILLNNLNIQKQNINKPDSSKDILVLENLVIENSKELDAIKNEYDLKIKDKTFLDDILNIFSEKGFKKFYIKSILPVINKKLPDYLKILNVPYNIKFDDNFNAKITSLGEEIPVHTLSTGEKKKMDISVLLSILYFLKMKIKSINLLFLDEIFSSLDIDSINNLLIILKNLSKELNLHIFVINHSFLDESIFTNLYKIEKSKGFSNLYLIKNKNI